MCLKQYIDLPVTYPTPHNDTIFHYVSELRGIGSIVFVLDLEFNIGSGSVPSAFLYSFLKTGGFCRVGDSHHQ